MNNSDIKIIELAIDCFEKASMTDALDNQSYRKAMKSMALALLSIVGDKNAAETLEKTVKSNCEE